MQGSVRKKGNRWYYSFEVGKEYGKRKRVERAGGRTKKEALEALRKAISEFNNCGSINTESDMSVSDYFDYWLKEYVEVNCKLNTYRSYVRIIEKHIKPAIGIYRLKQVNSTKIQELLNLKYRNGFSKNYLSNLYGVLSGAFKMAVAPYNLLKISPITNVSLPKYDKTKDSDDLKIISMDDYDRIISRFPFESNFHIPLHIAFHTGMRAAEVMGLTWDRINLDTGYITVDRILIYKGNKEWIFGTPKTLSSNREIKIGSTLIGLLKKNHLRQSENKLKYGEYYTESNFVSTKENGDQLTTDSLKYLSRVINYELMITFNFHSLRHTHATMLLEAGANIKDIQTRLGHSKLATTMDTYSHVTKKMKENSVDIFESMLKNKTSDIVK